MKVTKAHYTNLVIGFGKGGKTLAAYLANQGEEIAIIERSTGMYGGTCINIACIPTKSLITNAEKGIEYPDAHRIKDELVAALRKKNYDKIENLENSNVIDGEASFLSENSILLKTDEGEQVITADRVFINTGTEPFLPEIKGIQERRIYNSTTIMELEILPEKIAIVGGGFIGLEFADMFLKYGCEVTIFDRSDIFLPKEDLDIAESIRKNLTSRGLRIVSGVEIEQFLQKDAGVEIQCTKADIKKTFFTDAVLMATGRTPVTEKLNLGAAGIDTDERGFVKVNDQLQTSAKNVWAIGDVNGGPQFTYISLDDFRVIKNQLFGGEYDSIKKRKSFATVVFISPPFARVGISEKEAQEKGLNYSVFTLSAENIPKAAILQQKEGLLKAIVEKGTGKILGCMLYCAEAHEFINIVQLAMNSGLRYEVLRDSIYTHPSMAESFNDLFS